MLLHISRDWPYCFFVLALAYIQQGEFPEIIKLRIDVLKEQHCDDLALNLCSWCMRSPVFQSDATLRKTFLLLLFKQGHDVLFHEAVSLLECTNDAGTYVLSQANNHHCKFGTCTLNCSLHF